MTSFRCLSLDSGPTQLCSRSRHYWHFGHQTAALLSMSAAFLSIHHPLLMKKTEAFSRAPLSAKNCQRSLILKDAQSTASWLRAASASLKTPVRISYNMQLKAPQNGRSFWWVYIVEICSYTVKEKNYTVNKMLYIIFHILYTVYICIYIYDYICISYT